MRVVVVASLLGLAAAQEAKPEAGAAKPAAGGAPLVTRLLPLNGYQRYAPPGTEEQPEVARKRFERLLQRLVQAPGGEGANDAGQAERRILQLARSGARGDVIVIRQPQAEADLVSGVLGQLAMEEPLHVRVHCSVVTMPLAVATAHGLRPGVTAAVEDTLVTAMTRDACRRGGSLHNLPELRVAPLRPFAVDGPGAATAVRFALRGEMLPVTADEVVLALDLERRVPVADKPETVQAVAQPNVRLTAGRTALVVAVAGDTVTALVVRCVDCQPAPLEVPK